MNILTHTISPVIRNIFLIAGLMFLSVLPLKANDKPNVSSPEVSQFTGDTIRAEEPVPTANRESLFPAKSLSLAFSHFTWGAEAGASIDLTGYDMSTIDVDVLFGYKNSFIRMAGIGAGIHRTVQGGDNFIPVYATIQTSFTRRPSICFMSLKVGYSFNSINDSPTFGDTMASAGLGVNLSRSRWAKSYLLASIGYRHFNKRHMDKLPTIDREYVIMAQLTFGVSF